MEEVEEEAGGAFLDFGFEVLGRVYWVLVS